MSQIDMTAAPKDATHYNLANKGWYREFAPGVFGYWKDGSWAGSTATSGKHMVAVEKIAEPKQELPSKEEVMPIPDNLQHIPALHKLRDMLYGLAQASMQEEEKCTCPDCTDMPQMDAVVVTGAELQQALSTEGGMEALIASKTQQPTTGLDKEASSEDLQNLDEILAKVADQYINVDAENETDVRTVLAATYCVMKELGFHK